MIEEGRVKVGGKTIKSAALNVVESDAIMVDGKLLQSAEAVRLWLYHKPPGLMTTHNDPEGRKTVSIPYPKPCPASSP